MTSRYVGCAKKPAFSPIKYHFRRSGGMKSMATLQDMRSDAAKINIIPLQASVFNILRLFSGRRERPTKALRQPAGHRDQQPEISVATMRSSGQCMPSAGRLPITAVAHTSSTAIVPQRRRGHSSPAASNAQLAANIV